MTPDPLIVAIEAERVRRGLSKYALSLAAGLDGHSWRRIHRQGGATIHSLHKFAAAVGLEVVLIPTLQPRQHKPHGTLAALRRHQAAHEKPCEPCRRVENARGRLRTAAKRAVQAGAA